MLFIPKLPSICHFIKIYNLSCSVRLIILLLGLVVKTPCVISMPYQAQAKKAGVYFEMDSINTSEDGYIKLSWNDEQEDGMYEIQQASDPDFQSPETIYQGPDLATFISGLRNGTYYYRVREGEGQWSKQIVLEVKHHSLQLAFFLFGMGATVFLLTAWVIIRGAKKEVASDKI